MVTGRLRRRHFLPYPGEILVGPGDPVEAGSRWAVCHPRGKVGIRDVTRITGVPPAKVGEAAGAVMGQRVSEGTVIARATGGFVGRRDWIAPWTGQLVHLSALSGLGFFREELDEFPLYCRISGVVIEAVEGSHVVIEGQASAIRCAFGAGGTGFGRVLVASAGNEVQFPLGDQKVPSIVLITDPLDPEWLDSLPPERVSGVIAPSISPIRYLALAERRLASRDVSGGSVPVPVLLTEGIGRARMPPALQRLLRDHEGRPACAVASSRPGECEILLLGRNAPPPGRFPPLRLAGGPLMGAQASAVGQDPVTGRNGAGFLVPELLVQRDEGGRLMVPLDNLEFLE